MFLTAAFSWQVLIMWWSVLPLFVATVIGTIRFRKLPLELRYLVGLTWWMMATEIVSRPLWFTHLPNLFLKPVYDVGVCALLIFVFGEALQSSVIRKRLYWLLIIFAGYVLFDSLTVGTTAWFRPLQEVAGITIVLLLVGLYFKKLLDELTVHRLDLDPIFWVSVGLVFYGMGSVLIFLFSNYILFHNSKSFNLNIWAFHSLLLGVLTSFYAFALYVYRPFQPTGDFLKKEHWLINK